MKSTTLILILLLTACAAPVTKESIRSHAAYSTTHAVNQPYQKVFASLLKQSRNCYLNKPTDTQLTLVGNKNNGAKTANITLEYVYAKLEHDVIVMIDLKRESVDKTTVNVYTSRKNEKSKVDVVKKWIDNPGFKEICPV